MPIIEAGFTDENAQPDLHRLILFGPTVRVVIGHFKSEEGDSQKEDEAAFALVDTGATESCIDAKLAEKLELPVVDVRTIGGVGGASEHNVYMAEISIPDLKLTQYGRFTGVNLADGGQYHQALLGRTFLQNAIMIYDGFRGQITITTNT